MQKLKKTALILGLFIILILTLTGCGADISTKLTIDNSFAGSRKIVCTVSKSDVRDNFKGGAAKIDEIIKNKCPSELTCTKSEDASNYIYTFTLTFNSKEDYESKLEKILQRKPNVDFSTPNTLFIKGFRITENFNSQDILGWFKKAVEEEKLMDNVSNLWELGETTVEYAGNSYKTSGNINLNQIQYNPIKLIIFSTSQGESGTFYREITFCIPNTTLQNISTEIEDYMLKRVPQGGKGEWKTTDYGKDFIITFSAESAEELALKTSTVLDSKNNTISIKEDTENSTAFKTQTIFEETLDCSAFVSQNGSRVNISYIYATYGDNQIIFVQKETNDKWQDVYISYNDGVMSFDDEVNTCHLKIGIKKQYLINKVNIIMKQLDNNRYERSIMFEYDKNTDIKGAELAKKYFESLNAPFTITTAEEKDGVIKCTVTITGSSEEITKAVKKLFGEENNITYFRQNGILKINKSTLMQDTINMSEFLLMADYNNTINYTLITEGKEKIKGMTFESNGNKDIKSIGNSTGQFSSELSGYDVTVKYNGTVFSPLAVLLICLMIIIPIILIIFGVTVLLKAQLKKSGENNISYKDGVIRLIKSIRIKGSIIFEKSLNFIKNMFGKVKISTKFFNNLKMIDIKGISNESIEDTVIPKTTLKLSSIIKILLLFAIVCFFLPFFTVSCGNEKYAMTFNGWTSTFGTTINTGLSNEKIDGNPICILLLLLPAVSLIILTVKTKLSKGIKFVITSLSSFISFVILLIFKSRVTEEIQNTQFGILDLKFRWGYKLSIAVHIIIIVAAAFISFFIITKNKNTVGTVQNEIKSNNEITNES